VSDTLTQVSKEIGRPGFDSLDELGWRILCELQQNARISFSELGRRVGLTPPAAAERVRRLEDAGVITGFHVSLDLEKLGRPLLAIVRLAPRGVLASQVKQGVAEMSEVLECHHITGDDCYVLKVAVASVHALEGFLEQLARYGNTTTSVVISSPVTSRIIGPPD
jgi:Lrp/AsnC family leucine-responsive transcriptional regulator